MNEDEVRVSNILLRINENLEWLNEFLYEYYRRELHSRWASGEASVEPPPPEG